MPGGHQADQERGTKADDRSVCAVAEDQPLRKPSQHRQNVRLLQRPYLLLHPDGVYGGRVAVQAHQSPKEA